MIETKPSGHERSFAEEEIIVSKTDLKGRITYANQVFARVAGYRVDELLGQPHSIVRHPDMPRCVFKLLWDTIEAKQEIFAYVLNMAKNGDHYWVFANVTPTLDRTGNIIGYHSNRRKPDRDKIEKVVPLYQALLAEEKSCRQSQGGHAQRLRHAGRHPQGGRHRIRRIRARTLKTLRRFEARPREMHFGLIRKCRESLILRHYSLIAPNIHTAIRISA